MKALLEKVRTRLRPRGLGRVSMKSGFQQRLRFPSFGVTFLWLLTRPCLSVSHPGARRAHLSGSTSPGRGRCRLFGAGKEGTGREAGTEWALRARAPLTHVSHPQRVLRSAAPCLGGCRFHSRPLPQGYDPDATAPFQPKPKQKGRSSTASLVKRKRKVMDQEHRVRGQGGGQAGRPAGSALLLAPPTCGFSPVSPHPGQSPPEPGAAAAEAREGQAHRGPAVSPGQIRALSQAPRGPGATFFPHTHLWGMTRPWNEGAGSPLPPGVDSWFLGWGWGGGWPVLKRNVDFWITCLHHPGNLSPAHIQPGLLSDAGACLPSGPTPVLLWPCRAP